MARMRPSDLTKTTARPGHGTHAANGRGAADPVKDPVCGMTVDRATSRHLATHLGKTYAFCSERCRARFLSEPDRFLEPRAARAGETPSAAGTLYTCPMHPEIRQVGPGSCPICGMALEPVIAQAATGPSAELRD